MARIRVLKPYGLMRIGQVVPVAMDAAKELVAAGMAEYVEDEGPECATVEAPENAMARKPRKRRARKAKAK